MTHHGRCWFCTAILLVIVLLFQPSMAWASRLDNRYDGNIFALYAGDGALVPPRNSLGESLKRHRPTVLAFYLDDSSDCKRFAPTLSRLKGEFGMAVDVIALSTDSLAPPEGSPPDQPSHYWRGLIPQVVIFDQNGDVVLDRAGQIPLEDLEQGLAQAADLQLPDTLNRGQSRSMEVNEINAEVVRGG